ncbi:DUF447 domain-containing protein [Halocatena pleomorpha]|uniref:DUF447 family protein n=1 Tax=Halocatena pleomorpha TaxID=1785090 RepID=A0A3P3RDY9_9EURY|nr:DUF447 domain-containing protein [Halocatena pleomorpha]RRJ31686.1 DUF447 family protein [Halocatena pleomorpha]
MTESDWPLELSGVTESIITTLGPNDRWNVAVLGLFAGGDEAVITARTWGRTRTRHNLHERAEGYVQFTRDPVDFVEAACSIREEETPILDSADAWVRVAVESIGTGNEGHWEEWVLTPVESAIEQRVVPTTNRGYYAIIEATVAASRLDVPEYDTDKLRARIDRAGTVVDRCGGKRERAAWERFEELVE